MTPEQFMNFLEMKDLIIGGAFDKLSLTINFNNENSGIETLKKIYSILESCNNIGIKDISIEIN